jgi:hypothetical protein
LRFASILRETSSAGALALDLIGPLPHPVLQSLFDPMVPPGLQYHWKAHFVDEISDPAIDIHLKLGSAVPNMFSTMHLYPINGAVHEVEKTDTAWSYRDSTWAQVIVGVDPDPANKDKIVQLGAGLLDRAVYLFRSRCLCDFHDGRGRRTGSRDVS